MIVNFITLKWGTKYGPEYINRLYANLLNAYTGEFEFHCFTDDATGLTPGIHIRDIKELRPHKTKCFTLEKIYLFDGKIFKGNCVLLDIDILILKDLYPYLSSYNFSEGRFIMNYWNGIEDGRILSKFGRNWINSSFVTWQGDQLKHVVDFYNENKDIIEYKYGDLDFFLFQGMKDKLNYHPENIVYSYNEGASLEDNIPFKYREDYYIALFNTSHGRGTELHDTHDWSRSIWKQFD